MADEEHAGPGPVADALYILGILAVLVALWFATGGPKRANLKSIFLQPPAPSTSQVEGTTQDGSYLTGSSETTVSP